MKGKNSDALERQSIGTCLRLTTARARISLSCTVEPLALALSRGVVFSQPARVTHVVTRYG